MKNHPQKEDPYDVFPILKRIALLLVLSISFISSAFSQITEYPVPKPNPNYIPNTGKLEGNLLFMTYHQDADNYYVYEFKNNNWIAKGSIASPYDYYDGYNLAASGNKVMVKSFTSIKIFEYKNGNWVKTNEITPGAEFTVVQADIDQNKIVTQLISSDKDYGESFMQIYDYNGSSWVKTFQLPSIDSSVDPFFKYNLVLSGNHIAVSNGEASFIQMYTFTGSSWIVSDYLTSDFSNDYDFARAFDLEGNRLVVNTAKGYALVYEYKGTHWVETAQLNPAEGEAGDAYFLGYTISLSGNLVAFNAQTNIEVVFEYKNGHWIESFTGDWNNQDYYIDLSLSGKNLFVANEESSKLYKIKGFNNSELTKLLASDGKKDAAFGESVDIWSGEAIIGAPFDKEKGNSAGAAYIYQNHSGTASWNEIIKLTASDAGAGDQFGSAVAISGNLAVVGAPFDDDGGEDAGAVYVFELQGNTWVQKAKITASDAAAKDQFGAAVAMEGEYIIIGSPYDDYGKYKDAGSAYLFSSSGLITKLIPNDPKNGDQFGKSVAYTVNLYYPGDYPDAVVVGAPYHDDKGKDSGAAYVFSYVNNWQPQKLIASDGKAYDRFGISVAIDENNIIVGAPLSDDDGAESGSAYTFNYDTYHEVWSETAKLTASDATAQDRFGSSVAIADNKAIVGASYADISSGTNAGAAYAYISDGENWVERKKLTGKARTGDRLGYAVAISGSRVLAGAYHDDDPVMGKDAGAAYIFDIYKISDLPSSPIMARTIEKEDQKEKVVKEETESVKNPLAGIKEMKIYPNPFAEKLSIVLDQEQAQPVEITLMDQLGRTLYHRAFTAAESQQLLDIDLSKEKSITSGLVFLGLKTQQGNSQWIRLLKE